MRQIIVILLAAAMAFLPSLPQAHAGGKKAPKFSVSFHIQTHQGEGPKMVFKQLVAGQERWFRIIPEITTKDVQAYRTFASEIGDFGLELQLNDRARKRLFTFSSTNIGKWLLAQANGRVVDGVKIDQPIRDGRIVIWKGISAQEVRALEGTLPYIGETPAQFKARKKASR